MILTSQYTLYREGYFMSLEEQELAKQKALYEFTMSKQRYELLKNEAEKLAKHFEGWAKSLRSNPEAITFGGRSDDNLREYKGIGKLVDDLKETREEYRRLGNLVRDLGMADLIKS